MSSRSMLGGSGVTTTTTTTTRALPRWQEDVVYALPIEQDATAKVPDEVIRNIEDYILNEDEKRGVGYRLRTREGGNTLLQ